MSLALSEPSAVLFVVLPQFLLVFLVIGFAFVHVLYILLEE